MPSTPTEIARSLTAAQREALLAAVQDGELGKWFIRFYHADSAVIGSLRQLGLGFAVWSGICLNDDGLAVRDFLREQGR